MNTRTLQDMKEDKTMCALYRKFIGFLTAVGLTIGSAGPAYADDTEIYFGGAVNSNARPNILLILDTSSSMKSSFEGSTRLEVMKDVMLEVIRTVENVNLGVMIFNKGGDGGHVSYPITYIDEDLTDATITRVVSDGADDGEEDLATNVVTLNANPLVTSTVTAGATVTNTYKIANRNDDAEEFWCPAATCGFPGWFTRAQDEPALWLSDISGTMVSGMRFTGTNIPAGSRVDAGTLTLTHAKSKGFESATGTISGEKVSSPGGFFNEFDTVSGVGQLTPRYQNNPTTNTATIKTLTSTNAGDKIDTDVTAVIDELVGDPTWSGVGPIALYMHSAVGDVIDFCSNSDALPAVCGSLATISNVVPALTVTHTNPAVVTTDKLLGFRFKNLQLPQGTVVTNARLTLTAALTSTGDSTYLISGEVPDAVDGSSDPFVAGAGGDLSSRPKTGQVPWTLGYVDDNDPYVSPNISGVVNQIVGHSNWCGGNDLTIFVERETFSGDPSRAFYPAEVNSTELMPKLELEYDPATANGCFVATESAAIASDDDDAEQDGSSVDTGSGDLDISDKMVGLRFTDIDVPNGAEIISARITLVADADNSSSVTVTIDGELTGDALIFDEVSDNISDRTRTSAQVNWSVPDYNQGSAYDTPDLSDIVREITSQGSWASGNAMAFIFSAGSNNRPTVSHDDSPGNAARLEIQYRSNSGVSLIRTARDEILDFVSAIVAGSGTPIVEVMFEAAQYWTGGEVIWGASRWNDEFNRLSIESSYTGGTVTWPAGCTPDDMGADACDAQVIDPTPTKPFYISPFTSDLSCQKNYQVLLTDGSANNNDAGADQIRVNYLGGAGAACITEFSNGDSVDYSDEECGVDLVKHMYENDLDASLANDQTVITNTVGFVFSDQFLRDMALQGGGNFYESNSSAELAAAFTQFFGSVRNLPTSIVAPSLASNSFNRLLSRDEVYFGLFTPFLEKRWPGNVKKYNVCIATADGCNLGDILDANGNVATDAQNRFRDTSQSVWSDTAPVPVVDGIETIRGGAGAQMDDFTERLIYTDVTNTGAAPAINSSLSNSGRWFDTSNWNAIATEKIRDEICGVGADISAGSVCESLMLWVLGSNDYDADADEDVSATTRWTMNDVLHSSPRVITYGGRDNDADGIIDVYFDKVVVGTNEGGLRFLNGVTGKEEWTFMPKKLLGQQDILQTNAQGNHLYGIDSTPTLYSKDIDFDGVIEPADGDFVHTVSGMRRGGRDYYALNLTASLANEASQVTPRFLWRIEGGTAGDYARMGQTWSEPVITTIKTGGTGFASDGVNTPVMIVGGGYDDVLDTSFGTLGTGGLANKGNAIYFIDPADGTLIFSISGPGSGADIEVPGMLYAIAAEPTVADTDGDGDDDRVFIADTAGNIWRVDLAQDIGAAANPEGSTIVGKLASLSDPSVATDHRMFFEKIAFVQVKDSTYSDAANGEYDYILVGSGTRPDPLETTVEDRFYGIRDRNVSPMTDSNGDNLAEDYPSAAGPIDNTTLIDITSTILDPTSSAHKGGDGWYYDFDSAGDLGEKVMAQARVVAGTVVFTTYSPDAVSSSNDACAPNIGGGFAYNFNILNGKATLDWDTDGTIEDFADRKLSLGGGIPSEVVPVFTEEGVVGIVGVEGGAAKVGTLAGVPRVRTYWYEEVY